MPRTTRMAASQCCRRTGKTERPACVSRVSTGWLLREGELVALEYLSGGSQAAKWSANEPADARTRRRSAGCLGCHSRSRLIARQVCSSSGEPLPVGGGTEPVVRLESAGEVVLIRPANSLPDTGDRLIRMEQEDRGVLHSNSGQVCHRRQAGCGFEDPEEVPRGEV